MTRVHDLIEASSLGTPEAKALRESVSGLVLEPTEHHVTFDHSPCEHDDGDDHSCNPYATFTCEADPTEPGCRMACGDCDSWAVCDDCDSYGHPEYVDTHCTNGNLFVTLPDCNAIEWFDNDGGTDCYIDFNPPPIWFDSAIVIEWTGDGCEWHYPQQVKA